MTKGFVRIKVRSFVRSVEKKKKDILSSHHLFENKTLLVALFCLLFPRVAEVVNKKKEKKREDDVLSLSLSLSLVTHTHTHLY